MADNTVTVNVNNELSPQLIKKPSITLLAGGQITEKTINTALSSIQNALDDLVRQINNIQEGSQDKEITLSLSDDKKVLNVNIQGTAQKAFDDEDGNNLKDTYLNENNMTLDKENQTLYMYTNKSGGQ